MSSSPGSPQHAISDRDHGAYVLISAYVWASLSIIAASTRFTLAFRRKVKPRLDEITLFIALLAIIAGTISYHVATDAGLGKHISDVASSDLPTYLKASYAAQIFAVIATGGGKLCSLLLSQRVVAKDSRYYIALIVMVVVWIVFSLFACLFQCGLPTPWAFLPSTCPNHGKVQYAVTVLNIISDITIATRIIPTVWVLKMALKDRTTVILLFGARLIIPCLCVGQLFALADALPAQDQTWFNVRKVLYDQAIFNLSVLCAILPRVNRFLSDLSDSLSQPQITNFELDPEISKNGSRQGCGSVLQLTPATGSMLNTFIDGGLRKMVPRPRSGQFPLETKKEQDTSNLIIRDNAVVQTWELTTETEIRKHDAMTPGEGDSL